MQETKQTLYELIAGVVLCFLLFLLGNIFVSDWIAYTLGLSVGSLIAGIISGHMYRTLMRAMLYDEEAAAKRVQGGTFLRFLLMLAGLASAIIFPEYISVVGVALGLFSLKFSAYLQPLTHKVLKKIINKGR